MEKILVIVLFSFVCSSTHGASIITRIVNGTDADISDYPFIVSLRSYQSHSCGASLLNSEWVLTAAHCTFRQNVRSMSIVHSSTQIPGSSSNIINVAKSIVHERYDDYNIENDIALLKLAKPVESPFENFQVKLPKQDELFETGTPSVLIGWGRNASNGMIQTTLQKADLQIYSAEDCAKIHSDTVFKTNICSGVPGGYKGQCNGDSGGPLLVNGVQVGIVSWSVKPCTVPPYPGVFTAVASYIDWISKNTGIDFSNKSFSILK